MLQIDVGSDRAVPHPHARCQSGLETWAPDAPEGAVTPEPGLIARLLPLLDRPRLLRDPVSRTSLQVDAVDRWRRSALQPFPQRC